MSRSATAPERRGESGKMAIRDFQEVLISVWPQNLVDGAKHVLIDEKKYPVKMTAKRGLKQVDFQLEDHELHGARTES